ncbi:odorant receptor 85e [Aphomia sociella]
MFGRKIKKRTSTLNTEKIHNYTHFLEMPLKIVGCWEWLNDSNNEYATLINNIYLGMVLFVLIYMPATLMVNLYTEWADVMTGLHKISDCLPFLMSIAIVGYFAAYRLDMYDLINYMNVNFEYYSANGLTNMTMLHSYQAARNFAYIYTVCTMFSVTMYTIPDIINLYKRETLDSWIYMDMERSPFLELAFLRQCLTQAFVGLAMGQLGVFFASNSILLCGQLDLLCCSLRNARYTALLQSGVEHATLVSSHTDIRLDELNNYKYNTSEMNPSLYNFNKKVNSNFMDKTTRYDIYNARYDTATSAAFRECARVAQITNAYKEKFEAFVSPLLVLRVIQVTLYLCTLLYAATSKFDMVTAEYLAAVALDIFVYCYYGNQIITQADRVTTAAYQSAWHTMGVKPRRLLTNLLLANQRAVVVRAGRFLPMDLHTFVVIIKTSFSYYTLLVNVNEQH